MRPRKASTHSVFAAIKAERKRQAGEWDSAHDSLHSLDEWLDILRHELEEARVAPSTHGCLTEILHVAAVAVAALEWVGLPEEVEG